MAVRASSCSLRELPYYACTKNLAEIHDQFNSSFLYHLTKLKESSKSSKDYMTWIHSP